MSTIQRKASPIADYVFRCGDPVQPTDSYQIQCVTVKYANVYLVIAPAVRTIRSIFVSIEGNFE